MKRQRRGRKVEPLFAFFLSPFYLELCKENFKRINLLERQFPPKKSITII